MATTCVPVLNPVVDNAPIERDGGGLIHYFTQYIVL